MTLANRFRTLVGEYPRTLWLVGLCSFLNIVGLSFIWPITTVYIHDHLGYSLTVAGVVLLFHHGAGALGSLVGGYFFDRLGARWVLLISMLAAGVVIALPGFYESWWLFVAVMVLFGFFATMFFPAINALAAKAWPEGGRRSFNFVYVMHNVGVAVGTSLGGILADRSFALAFLGAAIMSLVVAVVVFFRIHDRPDAGQTAAQEISAALEPEGRIPWLPVGALFAGFLTLWMIYVQWQAVVSVYMKGIGYPLTAYSVLWTLNGLIIVLGQPLLSLVVRRARTLSAQLFLGTGLYVVSYGLLLMFQSYEVFVAAMVVLTFGEMLLWPGIPAAVSQLSPPSRRGFLQGFIGSAGTMGRMLGPLLGGALYDRVGYLPLMGVMTVLYIVPVATFLIYRRSVR